MVDQISSEIISVISVSRPPEDKGTIPRDAQIAFVLQRFEEEILHNLEEKKNMVMRDGEFANMMQQQEEEKAQKSIEK